MNLTNQDSLTTSLLSKSLLSAFPWRLQPVDATAALSPYTKLVLLDF